jgi:signal transduction histidine kinase/DNA-binding NarL/FixJ family response regulator
MVFYSIQKKTIQFKKQPVDSKSNHLIQKNKGVCFLMLFLISINKKDDSFWSEMICLKRLIIDKMKNWYKIINSLGINDSIQSNYEIKKIKLFNTFCFCWYATAIVLILNYLTKSPVLYLNISVHFFQLGFIILAHYLHTKGKHETGRLIYVMMLIVNGFLFGSFIRKGQLLEFYLILAPALSLIFSDNKKINYTVLFLSFAFFAIPNCFLNNYPNINLFSPALTCLFFLYFILVNYFKKMNQKNERLLELERDKVVKDKVILEEQKTKLDELNEFKSHFFINLSHEIRTPLTLIQGYASRINFNSSSQENQEKINIINTQINQIQNIIDNILDLGKIDSNEFVIYKKAVAIIPFLNKHYLEFKELFDKKEIHFDLKVNIPDIYVEMDEDLMSKSLNNLLTNALKFTPKNGLVQISVLLNDSLQISIQDTGIGIPKYDIEKVFERFYQSKNDITKSQGSGIGLSFTKSILEAHHFEISLTSIQNVMTIFTIQIPKKAILSSANEIEESINVKLNHQITEKIQSDPKGNANKKRILLVEDHEQMRNFIKTVLHNYDIIEAENGQVALKILETTAFDIIITDYMMPVLDGEGFVMQLKDKGIKTPVIVLTARRDNAGKINMLRLGIDGYLNKPFIEEELLLMIKKSISSLEILTDFEATLDPAEKESLNAFACKFNVELNDYINANLHSSNFGVEDIAMHLNISKSTLNRKIKLILGQTTQDVIMEARFQKAKLLLLENPHATKKEVAESIGIANTSYFFNKMNTRFGMEF